MNVPVYIAQRIADSYNAAHGLGTITRCHYVHINAVLSTQISYDYIDLPTIDYSPDTVLAYTMLGREIEQQYQLATHMGITFTPWDKEGQPYANSHEMCNDVDLHNHLYFFTGGAVHPFLGAISHDGLSLNDKFRAIHDLFGHCAGGYTFGARGEENAWVHHSMMFSPWAQRAITTETRGQNSWFNFGPYSLIPACDRPFAEQKCALLPAYACDWRKALDR